MTPIKYVGHRAEYREGAYGSGIVFQQGETISVEDALAVKLLRHPDVYQMGEAQEATASVAGVNGEKKQDDDDPAQELRDSVGNMTKGALEGFAKTHFNVDLDKRKSVGDLRTQVIGLIDQFGVE